MERITKIVLLSLMTLGLVACGNKPAEIKTVYVTKVVVYVPAPPVVEKPEFVSPPDGWDRENDIMVAIKLFNIDAKQVYNYSYALLTIVDKYIELSKDNPNLETLLNDSSISDADKSKLKSLKKKWDEWFK